jgi:hypothetical protein
MAAQRSLGLQRARHAGMLAMPRAAAPEGSEPMSREPRSDEHPSDDEHTPREPAADTSDDADGGEVTEEPASGNAELARVGRPSPPRPPRRTGVFLDAEDLRVHVGELLRAILGHYEVDPFGNFTFTHEGARIFVTVGPSPVGPQVGVFSVTNLDVELTEPLARFLLTTNHSLGFGSFSYDSGNQAVWLRHSLLGTTLDLPELHATVAAIASTAALLDERIRDEFGGRTFDEAPEDVRQRMEPPEAGQTPSFPGAGGYL